MEPVQFAQLLSATRGTLQGVDHGEFDFDRVSIDSRKVQPGDVFWAVKGERHDGHNYIQEAQQRGARLCVVEQNKIAGVSGPLVKVENTIQALGDFARWYRHRYESLIIGVTGSVGKTTTREMIYAVLSDRHQGIQSAQNFNNEFGLPLTLLGLSAQDEFGVFEMGASRIGDIRGLCEIACPEVGVITKVGLAHLQTFGSAENVFQGKGELLESLLPHGFAVIGGDDEQMRAMASRAVCPVIFVGESRGNQVRATDIECKQQKWRFTVDRKKYEVQGAARHILTSALCAIAVAREVGMDASAIASGLQTFASVPGRCRVEQVGGWTLIDDTYNANPTSMRAACLCLKEWSAANKRILIAGDMLELGPDSPNYHREIGATVAELKIDRLLTLGESSSQISRGAIAAGMDSHSIAECRDLDALSTVLDCWLEPGDTVLVKGSRGMRMELVVEWMKQRNSEIFKEHAARSGQRAVA